MSTLRRFVAGPDAARGGPLARFLQPRPVAGQRCELCAVPVDGHHRHLVDLPGQRLVCSCRACALLFPDGGAARGRYRVVPERYLRVEPFAVEPAQWAALQVPVAMAFFLRSSVQERTVAFYPGPAGATESELPPEAWDAIVAANPVLGGVEADVEATLVRRAGGAACFVVPVDRCYELAGQLRRTWRGFDGGREAREAIERFFADVRARSRLAGEA